MAPQEGGALIVAGAEPAAVRLAEEPMEPVGAVAAIDAVGLPAPTSDPGGVWLEDMQTVTEADPVDPAGVMAQIDALASPEAVPGSCVPWPQDPLVDLEADLTTGAPALPAGDVPAWLGADAERPSDTTQSPDAIPTEEVDTMHSEPKSPSGRLGHPRPVPEPDQDLGNLPEWYRVFLKPGAAIVRFPRDLSQPPVITRYTGSTHESGQGEPRLARALIRHR